MKKMLTPKSRFSEFVSQFNFGNVQWIGPVGHVQLNESLVARIELSEFGHLGHFSGFRVEIISKIHGKIDSLNVMFNYHFDNNDRVDNRIKDYNNGSFHAWASNGGTVNWYIATPSKKAIASFSDVVEGYLSLWM